MIDARLEPSLIAWRGLPGSFACASSITYGLGCLLAFAAPSIAALDWTSQRARAPDGDGEK